MADLRDAERLEELVPRLMRVLLPSAEADPLAALPIGQLRLMRALGNGARIAAEVGAELGTSPSALSQMVHRLEEAGLLKREECAEDKRHKTLRLTEAGACRMAERRRLRAERAQAMLTRISEAERHAFLEVLERMVTDVPPGEPKSAAAEVVKGSPF
ncbi:MAG: MarR family winged helix-turn-helix transcriptional regulator [Fimbriimonas sp.]